MGWREVLVGFTPRFLLRLFAGPYIAGNSLSRALEVVDELYKERGISSTLDLLGEGIGSPEDVQAELDEYLRMVEALASRPYATLSLKPTQLGLAIDPQLCFDNMTRLLERARDAGIQITIDMEESDYTEATLQLHRSLRETFDNVGTVLQSRLHRTLDDVDAHLDGIRAHIRLCLGIYKEPPEIAYQRKDEIKENFVRVARKLWQQGHFVGIATHDEVLLRRVLAEAKTLGIGKQQFEVQMLLGVPRDAIHKEVLAQGIDMRLYVPYGISWDHAYAYARRRLIENPTIGLYVAGNLLRRFREKLFGKKKQKSLPS